MKNLFGFAFIVFAIMLASHPQSADAFIGECYEAWSRCTVWSSPGTGILWRNCSDRCRTCAGWSGGSCQQREDSSCGAQLRCVCSGQRVAKSTNWLDVQTCRFGL